MSVIASSDNMRERVIKVIAIAGSLRKASFNRGLLRSGKVKRVLHSRIMMGFLGVDSMFSVFYAAVEIARESIPHMEIETLEIGHLPFLNTDLEVDNKFPRSVEELRAKVLQADSILFASPEYNYSVTARCPSSGRVVKAVKVSLFLLKQRFPPGSGSKKSETWLVEKMQVTLKKILMGMRKTRANLTPPRANLTPPFKPEAKIKIQPYDGDVNAEKLDHWLAQLEGSSRTSVGRTEVRRTKLGAEIQRKSAKSDIFVPGGPRDSWDVGTRKAETAESKKNRQVFVSRGFGTARTKVRAGRESADLPTDSPFRAVWRYLSQAVRGTVGTKVREGCVGREKAKKPQTGTRKPESAEARDFRPGQPGQRYARDAKSRNGRRQRRKVNVCLVNFKRQQLLTPSSDFHKIGFSGTSTTSSTP
ncbi:hypothetical protein KI387_023990 [Taxus chinensis]|uniref:NAD(P)H dehydrogenase (quinone) n=1 Tax=Taxus chinensis TaxID=29808 RepID=A0AA38L853_TAXCH|nr:hypothetical protein KI387_023990 [Taxus chinensis]